MRRRGRAHAGHRPGDGARLRDGREAGHRPRPGAGAVRRSAVEQEDRGVPHRHRPVAGRREAGVRGGRHRPAQRVPVGVLLPHAAVLRAGGRPRRARAQRARERHGVPARRASAAGAGRQPWRRSATTSCGHRPREAGSTTSCWSASSPSPAPPTSPPSTRRRSSRTCCRAAGRSPRSSPGGRGVPGPAGPAHPEQTAVPARRPRRGAAAPSPGDLFDEMEEALGATSWRDVDALRREVHQLVGQLASRSGAGTPRSTSRSARRCRARRPPRRRSRSSRSAATGCWAASADGTLPGPARRPLGWPRATR